MNMNCSGHSELRDPDWYDPDRSLARARNAIVETDTASRMHNSLASLNVDSLTIAEMNDQSYNHFSIRSLPIISSTTNTVTRIATAPDAPWNESTRSLRTIPGISTTNSNITPSNIRTSRTTQPPPGVSALDHLQNSLSNIMVSAGASNGGLPHDIITLEDDSDYDSLAGDQDDSLNESFVSLRLADVMNSGHDNNEMDETAHAGNVHRTHSSTTNYNHAPISPSRSTIRTSCSYRQAYTDSTLNNSYASTRSAPSPSRSMRHRYYTTGTANEAPSFSTLDEHKEYYNDGCDLGDNEDNNNVEVIKVLRAQIDTLKLELLKQQEQNQRLVHQYEYKNHMSQFLPMDSIVQHGNGGLFNYGNDSFVSTRSCVNDSKYTCKSSTESAKNDFTQTTPFDQQQHLLSEAELGITSSIAALKTSFFKKQRDKENCGKKSIACAEPQPVSPESDDSTNNLNDLDETSDNASLSLLDELVLCELEAHIKSIQRITKLQFETLQQQNEMLQAEVLDPTTRK